MLLVAASISISKVVLKSTVISNRVTACNLSLWSAIRPYVISGGKNEVSKHPRIG